MERAQERDQERNDASRLCQLACVIGRREEGALERHERSRIAARHAVQEAVPDPGVEVAEVPERQERKRAGEYGGRADRLPAPRGLAARVPRKQHHDARREEPSFVAAHRAERRG